MPSDFLAHLQAKAREPEPEHHDEPVMMPPMECPRCLALVLHDSMDKHIAWHIEHRG